MRKIITHRHIYYHNHLLHDIIVQKHVLAIVEFKILFYCPFFLKGGRNLKVNSLN